MNKYQSGQSSYFNVRATLVSSLLLPAVLLLGACGSSYRAPVDTAAGGERYLDDGRTHRVNEGETLYAVAWMYDLDPVALARANNLQEPYAISRGQFLTVDLRSAGIENGRAARPGAAAPVATTVAPAEGVRVNAVGAGTGISRAPLAGRGGLQRESLPSATPAPAEPAPQAVTPPAPQTTPVPATVAPAPAPPVVAVTPPPSTPAPSPALPAGPIRWAWPSDGRIVGRFDNASVDKKGIDFDGRKGDPVKAAADGQVVYAGSGLVRYGDLIILKHDERFLSAYAHNDRILVKEGDTVRQGQAIAELGSSGIDRNMLHFEIRVEGTPVDPLQFLPAR